MLRTEDSITVVHRRPLLHRIVGGPVAALLLCVTPAVHAQVVQAQLVRAQVAAAVETPAGSPSLVAGDSIRNSAHYWGYFAAGFGASLLLHEAGHIGMSLALGAHPSFGFNKGRPTVYSGISAESEPHKQFLFSAAGLTVQTLLDEGILDIPHHRGSAFERGVLASGIGTTLFYLTIGRSGSVSDIAYMSNLHVLTATEVTLLYGGMAAIHTFRIARDHRYANFFARPQPGGGVAVGVSVAPGP